MDQELIVYLDERFREASQQLAGFRQEMDERFREASQQLVDFRVEILQETSQQLAGLRKEMDERFKEVNETARQTLVLVEGLRDEIHLVAEAFLGADERVTRLEKSEALTIETVTGMVEPYFKSIDERGRELDARSAQIDVPVKDLQNRVGVLETRMTREDRNVMDAVADRVAGARRPQLPSTP